MDRVQDIYSNPPALAMRLDPMTHVSLADRLKHNIKHLTQWINRIDHQIRVTQSKIEIIRALKILFIYKT